MIVLSSCGGGGGGTSSGSNTPNTGLTLSGSVVKGPIAGAKVLAYQATDTSFTASIGEAVTDANGKYSLILTTSYQGLIVIRISGGAYENEATDVNVVLGDNDVLLSAATVDSSNTLISVTPLTDLAFKHAQNSGTTPTTISISEASEFIAGQFGLAGVDLARTVPTDVLSATPTNNAEGRYGTMLAAVFSQGVTSTTGDIGFSDVSRTISTYQQDLSDGRFDGYRAVSMALIDLADSSRIKSSTAVIMAVSNTIAPQVRPSIATNANLNTYILNQPIPTLTLSNLGGQASYWSLSPDLPQGLVFDNASGTISGTAIVLSGLNTYIVTASNTIAASSVTLGIIVNPPIPSISNLADQTFVQSVPINPLTFNNRGGLVQQWSISPDLPDNLNLSAIGQISGTPRDTQPLTRYTISASNATGVDSAIVNIQTNPSTPSIDLVASQEFTQGVAITPIEFVNVAGVASTWSINPALPSGLNFEIETDRAIISGIPSAITASVTYTVTASNITGSVDSSVILLVKQGPPILANLANKTYIQNTIINPFSSTNTGSTATIWFVSPNLPGGLSLNSNTGEISGTPLGVSDFVTYTITAGNTSGTGSTRVAIKINPALPNINNIIQQVYIRGSVIDILSVDNTGGVANTWSIAPNLPSGLNLSNVGQISGTPQVRQLSVNYVITASNVTGSDTANISIEINEPTPSIADVNTQNYIVGQAIDPITFDNNGGIINVWSINPALTSGLNFNTGTGIISGTPTTASSLISYTITATNNTGSDAANIQISVDINVPSIANLTQQTYGINEVIAPINFINQGGSATHWGIEPSLPNGLNFDTSSGQISGTPSTTSILTTYTVVASNTSGEDSAQVSIVVNAIAPDISNLLDQSLIKGLTITPIVFSNTGGAASSWSISPNLPNGLSFNQVTGVISGLPTVVSATTNYQVNVSNFSGQDSANINLVVVEHNRSISGRINTAPLIVVDTDVNDVNAPVNIPNNNQRSAQVINNHVTVHGFVSNRNASQYGLSGRFANSKDNQDVYRATLEAGQVINLQVSDHEGLYGYTGDVDIYLFNSNFTLVDYSLSSTEYERVTVPSNDSYYILIDAWSGLSKYVFSINPAGPINSTGTNRFNHQAAQFESAKNMDFLTHQSVVSYDNAASRSLNITLEHSVVGNTQSRISQAEQSSAFNGEVARNNLESYDKFNTLQEIKKHNQQAGVEYAEPNYIYRPLRVPNDTNYNLQWHYPLINLPQAWDITTGQLSDGDVIVAVIDSGVFLDHPDLQGKLVAGYDFISNISNARDGNGIDPDPDDVGDRSLLSNSSWHGTHVAGTVGAQSNNNRGVAGVSWDAKIMPLRVLGNDGGSVYDVLQAVLFAAGLPNDSGTVPTQRADIINLSLGGGGYSQVAQSIYTQARNTGVIVIAAAGNRNTSAPSYPAAYDGVVSVSAIDFARNRSYYSNHGDRIDIAAPGGDTRVDLSGDGRADGVWSTLVDGSTGQRREGYRAYQGTSMAAPHVAGVAALMKAVYPALTPAEFDTLLIAGNLTDEAGSIGRDNDFGYGIVNAYKAVSAAQDLAGGGSIELTPANIIVSPQLLNLSFGNSGVLVARNAGQTAAAITSVIENISWLSITPPLSSNGLGNYNLLINRTGLSDGQYSGVIEFHTDSGRVISNTIKIEINSNNVSDNYIASLLVRLVDINLQVVQTATANRNGSGEYLYSFSQVPVGRYHVIAGSDIDNDKRICQSGEICGAYPVVNQLSIIEVGREDVGDINFVVDILSNSLTFNSLREVEVIDKTQIEQTESGITPIVY